MPSGSIVNFVDTYFNISVIAGLFTYRLLSSFITTIFTPFIDMILPLYVTENMNISLNSDYQRVYVNRISTTTSKQIEYIFAFGDLLREFIIWITVMSVLFLFYKI